jgi:DNA-binding NtrC family response regulator
MASIAGSHGFRSSFQARRVNAPSGASQKQNILFATVDRSASAPLYSLLETYPVNILWAKALEQVRSVLVRESVAACFCGLWLVDGTYRDVVRQLRRQPAEIPVVIVCAPECPQEYRDYLAALNIRAFDFICHPYRRMDLERILQSAIGLDIQSVLQSVPSASSSNAAFVPSQLRRAS